MEDAFQIGLEQLIKLDLVFDTWHYHNQIKDLTILASNLPDLRIVHDHFGGPLGIGPYAGKQEEIFQQWKEDHVTDRTAVGQQHHQTVDSDPHSTGRRHANPQGLEEVGVEFGHRVLFVEAVKLGSEQLVLEQWVVEFGVGVGQFHAVDEQFESFGDLGIVSLPLGQRAEAGGIIDDENRSDQRVLNGLLEDLVDDDVRVHPVGVDLQTSSHLGHRVGVVHRTPGVFGEQLGVGLPGPGRGEVDLVFTPGQDHAVPEHLGGVDHDLFDQVHHRPVVAVSLVELDHRELGIVRRVDSLVAKHSADFIDPLDTADHQPLEVQFECDPHEQLDAQCVVFGDERSRCRAAGHRVQHRCLDLDEPLPRKRLANRVDDAGSVSYTHLTLPTKA